MTKRSLLIGFLLVVAVGLTDVWFSLPAGADPPTPEPSIGTGHGDATLRLPSAVKRWAGAEPIRVSLAPAGWTTILSENFEGPWPSGNWYVFDNNDTTYGEFYWANVCLGRNSSYSVWATGGGSDGYSLSCGTYYPNYLDSWMIYGPIDLQGATAAEMTFYFWLNSECTGTDCSGAADPLKALASTDGVNFNGKWWAGSWYQHPSAVNGWVAGQLDLSGYVGQPEVWIAFVFQSDGSVVLPGGAYVDDVVVRVYTATASTPTPTPTATRTPGTGGRIYGRVTVNGSPAAGVELDLRRWDGSAWSSPYTTVTAADGTYSFVGVSGLTSGQLYHVRYLNSAGTPGRLWIWWAPDITSYTTGSSVPGGDFDIGDVVLGEPNTEVPQPLPITFHWTMRNIAQDSYTLEVLDADSGEVLGTSSDLGHVDGVTINSLPPDFTPNTVYGWDVLITHPQGSGVSYGTHAFAFTGPVTPTPTPRPTYTPRPGTIIRKAYLPLVKKDKPPVPTPRPLCNANFDQTTLEPCWTSGGEFPARLVTQLYNDGPAIGQRTLQLGKPELGPVYNDSANLPSGSGWVEQQVTVPDSSTARLTFNYRLFSYDRSCLGGGESRICSRPSDNLLISVNDQLVRRYGYEGAWSNASPPPVQDLGWQNATLDLSRWRGQTVRLRFALWNDEFNYRPGAPQQPPGAYNTWGYVDEVAVNP